MSFTYADLIVTEVAGPSTTIGDPAEATISWTVRNVEKPERTTPRWTDRVIASTDAVLGNGDDRIIAEFVHEGELGVNRAYSRQESILLPAQVQGRFHLFVQTDAAQEVFENNLETNNGAEAAELFDVMPVPYADLIVESVIAASEGLGDQPLRLVGRR